MTRKVNLPSRVTQVSTKNKRSYLRQSKEQDFSPTAIRFKAMRFSKENNTQIKVVLYSSLLF